MVSGTRRLALVFDAGARTDSRKWSMCHQLKAIVTVATVALGGHAVNEQKA